jgi:hypothetical protein
MYAVEASCVPLFELMEFSKVIVLMIKFMYTYII